MWLLIFLCSLLELSFGGANSCFWKYKLLSFSHPPWIKSAFQFQIKIKKFFLHAACIKCNLYLTHSHLFFPQTQVNITLFVPFLECCWHYWLKCSDTRLAFLCFSLALGSPWITRGPISKAGNCLMPYWWVTCQAKMTKSFYLACTASVTAMSCF